MNAGVPVCCRGEIWTLNFDPRRGSEQGGFRPGLIVQTDLGNHAPGAHTTIVVPLTTQRRPYAFYIPIPKALTNGLSEDSWANATQLFTLDKSRLVKRMGVASPEQIKQLEATLRGVLELGSPL